MKFDTTRSDCILGIFLIGSTFALSLATALIKVFDPVLVETAAIILIVSSIVFLLGVLLIMMNSKEVGDKQVDAGASFMVTVLFIVAMLMLVGAGIATTVL